MTRYEELQLQIESDERNIVILMSRRPDYPRGWSRDDAAEVCAACAGRLFDAKELASDADSLVIHAELNLRDAVKLWRSS